MKKAILDLIRLFVGYMVCAIGVVMTLNADLGAAPWEVLHQGISNVADITIGMASIGLGFIIVIIDVILGQNIGWGTVLNMIFVGVFMDILMINKLVPTFNSFLPNLIMMLLGMLVLGYGIYIYMGTGYGSGPKDSLMVILTIRTKKSVRFVKNSLELFAIVMGYFLGGSVGIGTAIMSIAGGYFTQFAFETMKFDVSEVKHRYITDDIKFIKEKIQSRGNESGEA